MGTAANVLVGADGAVWFAPAGTSLPTSGSDSLDGAFVDLGYLSIDGVTEGHAQNSKNIQNWAGLTVRTLLTEQTDTLKGTFLETNPDVLETYHGEQTDAGTVVEVKKQTGRRGCWVVDVLDGDNVLRIVVPDGQVTATDDVAYKNDDAIQYPVTITCYPDDSDNTAYKYPPVALS